AGVSDRTAFTVGSFLEFPTDTRFDVVTAVGYFDYVDDPVPHWRKLASLCRGRLFISIPKRWEFRVPLRLARFALAKGFVRFYAKSEFLAIAVAAGVTADRVMLVDLGRDWLAIIAGDAADLHASCRA